MKKLVLVAIFLTIAIAMYLIFSKTVPVQTITVDDQHIQMSLPEGQVGEYYFIKSALGIELDASNYQFPKLNGSNNGTPSSIQLIIDTDRQYTVDWKPGVKKYMLNSATLIPRFKAFSGFKDGDEFAIGIGQVEIDYVSKEHHFHAQWVGMGHVVQQ